MDHSTVVSALVHRYHIKNQHTQCNNVIIASAAATKEKERKEKIALVNVTEIHLSNRRLVCELLVRLYFSNSTKQGTTSTVALLNNTYVTLPMPLKYIKPYSSDATQSKIHLDSLLDRHQSE